MAVTLTALVLSICYIITTIIPYFAGFLREWSGSFQAVWLMLLITLVIMLIVTMKFAPESYAKTMNYSSNQIKSRIEDGNYSYG